MQESLAIRGDIRLRVRVEVYNADPLVTGYYPIKDSQCVIEVPTPGLAWRVVEYVKQTLKQLAIDIEGDGRGEANGQTRVLQQDAGRGD